GGPRFFERQEIRDAHAYMRLVRSRDDDLAFERVVNTPKRGVGDTTVQKLQMAARDAGISLARAAEAMVQTDEIRGKGRAALRQFLYDLERWRGEADAMRHDELAEKVLDESGYTAMWRADKSPQAAGRLDNLKELVQSMGAFDTLEAYLEHVALVTDLDRVETGDEVWLMTLHAAKGLEFPLVFLPGWEETVFPSQRSLDENGVPGLEEERRLAYVGVTRARERAVISFAANRQIFGRWQSVIPSRFVDELPAEHVEARADTGYYDGPGASFGGAAPVEELAQAPYESPGWRRLQAAKDRRTPPPTIEGEGRVIASDSSEAAFAIGERVFHIKFGYGRIAAADGSKVTVDFEKAGRKKVIDSFLEKP
ncbi:MAG: DNA helicase II, partial [Caulobacterales bacterium]|nr:DNA helicase II [Caulobacterales bacterium]